MDDISKWSTLDYYAWIPRGLRHDPHWGRDYHTPINVTKYFVRILIYTTSTIRINSETPESSISRISSAPAESVYLLGAFPQVISNCIIMGNKLKTIVKGPPGFKADWLMSETKLSAMAVLSVNAAIASADPIIISPAIIFTLKNDKPINT